MSEYKVFNGDWENLEDVISAFGRYNEGENGPRAVLTAEGTKVLYAGYASGSYDGAGTLVYQRADGSIIINEGGHCSCYGMEDCWDPNEKPVTVTYLKTMHKDPEKKDYVYYGGDVSSITEWNKMLETL